MKNLMTKEVDILAFSPHPDDVEIGAGGALLLASLKGLRVVIVDLTEGEMSSRGTSASRLREKGKAAEFLKLSDRFSLNLGDTQICSDQKALLATVKIIRQTKPRIVLLPFDGDRHPDHAAAAHLIRKACFFASVKKFGQEEPHRPHHLYHYMIHSPFTPTFVIDISSVWENKVTLLKVYESQFLNRENDVVTALNGDFLEVLEARARYFGSFVGCQYGEPYLASHPLHVSFFPEKKIEDYLPLYRMIE